MVQRAISADTVSHVIGTPLSSTMPTDHAPLVRAPLRTVSGASGGALVRHSGVDTGWGTQSVLWVAQSVPQSMLTGAVSRSTVSDTGNSEYVPPDGAVSVTSSRTGSAVRCVITPCTTGTGCAPGSSRRDTGELLTSEYIVRPPGAAPSWVICSGAASG